MNARWHILGAAIDERRDTAPNKRFYRRLRLFEPARRPYRAPADLRRAVRGDQRNKPEDEGDRRHHHGAESHLRAENRRLADIHPGLALFRGEKER